MSGILFLMHCPPNTGYAIETLEQRFLDAGLLVSARDQIFFGYPSIAEPPRNLDIPTRNLICFDTNETDLGVIARFSDSLIGHRVSTVVGFDQPPNRAWYGAVRKAGVERIVAYWGAPMSDLQPWPKLIAKRLLVAVTRSAPDVYVFESEAMKRTAVYGRGIQAQRTRVVPLGADLTYFRPDKEDEHYAHAALGIPRERRLIYFSGHMEPRKGISVLISAARLLREHHNRRDFQVVILGNRGNEADPYRQMIAATPTEEHVSFCGYRNDVQRLQRGAYCAAILSTGWDSLTQSAIELTATGVPLVVSDCGGLPETVISGHTGLVVPSGDSAAAASIFVRLLDNPELRQQMSTAARIFALNRYSHTNQVSSLAAIFREH